MTRTRRALLAAGFTYTQFGLALVSGFVLFPLVVRHLGAHDNGLWLATGELVGYLLLTDLGVFAVLPLLVAAKDGQQDRRAVAECLSHGVAVGLGASAIIGMGAAALSVAPGGPPGIDPADWDRLRGPLTLVLGLTVVGFPLRAFSALLVGLQDYVFGGLLGVATAVLTVALTAALVPGGYGLFGLALAAGLPPLMAGLVAAVRAYVIAPDLFRAWPRPRWAGCARLVGQGFGVWVGGFGMRLMAASNGLIFAAAGRPDWATMYAGTGKAAQVLQPMCGVIPDSGLVGLAQVFGDGRPAATCRVVLCLLVLYAVLPAATAIGLLAANPSFVRAWLGPSLYAGDYVNGLLAMNVVLGSLAGGLYKTTGANGYRTVGGLISLAAGGLFLGLGLVLCRLHGIAGVAEAAVAVSLIILLPSGVWLTRAMYGLHPRELFGRILRPWAIRTFPFLVAAAGLGVLIAGEPAPYGMAVGAALVGAYLVTLRRFLAGMPWPEQVGGWLARAGLIPRMSPVP